MKDTEGKTGTPTPEQIAKITDASRVLRADSER